MSVKDVLNFQVFNLDQLQQNCKAINSQLLRKIFISNNLVWELKRILLLLLLLLLLSLLCLLFSILSLLFLSPGLFSFALRAFGITWWGWIILGRWVLSPWLLMLLRVELMDYVFLISGVHIIIIIILVSSSLFSSFVVVTLLSFVNVTVWVGIVCLLSLLLFLVFLRLFLMPWLFRSHLRMNILVLVLTVNTRNWRRIHASIMHLGYNLISVIVLKAHLRWIVSKLWAIFSFIEFWPCLSWRISFDKSLLIIIYNSALILLRCFSVHVFPWWLLRMRNICVVHSTRATSLHEVSWVLELRIRVEIWVLLLGVGHSLEISLVHVWITSHFMSREARVSHVLVWSALTLNVS